MARTLLKKSPSLSQILVSKKDLKYVSTTAKDKIKLKLDAYADITPLEREGLEADIILFVKKNSLVKQKLVLVLTSDVYFEKEFPILGGNEIEANSFAQMVPLTSKTIREYPQNSHSLLVVANKTFLHDLKSIFEAAKCSIVSVVPQLFYDQHQTDLKILKANSLLPQPIFKRFEPTLKVKVGVNRPSALIGVFILLVAILVAIFPANTPSKQSTPVSRSESTVSTTPTPTLTTISNATVKIPYTTRVSKTKADQLKTLLLKAGFVNVTTEQNTLAESSQTTIVFNVNFPTDLKEKVVYNANKVFNDISIQDTNDNQANVTITIGKNN
jgi:hypothetical protein